MLCDRRRGTGSPGGISMTCRNQILIAFFSMVLTSVAWAQTAPDSTADAVPKPPSIDPEALEVLKGMADYLVSATEFAFHTESGYDVLQPSGVTVEFGASRNTLVSRPNRLRIDSQRRDGMRSAIIFDGENIWGFGPDENVYAKTEQVGDLDESIDFVVAELRIKAPLADIVSPDLYEIVTSELTGALYLGETVLVGVVCDHLLMSNDYADYQLWIATGDQPLLQRIVITYREEPGQPQYRAQFMNWDMSPEDTKARLQFEPPDGAERIRFYVPASARDQDEEDRS